MTAVCEEQGIIKKDSYTCQTSHPSTTYSPIPTFDFSSKTTGNYYTTVFSSTKSF